MILRAASSAPAGPSEALSAPSTPPVRLVRDEAEFLALRDEWNALVALRPDLSLFGRHEWFEAAWQWRRAESELFLLVWRCNGTIRGIMPLLRRRTAGRPLPLRELSFLTVPDTQFCDLLAGKQDRHQAQSVFARALFQHRHEWDVVRLAFLPQDAVAGAGFASALQDAGLRCSPLEVPGNPFVSLAGEWAVYYASRSRRLKKANNLAANRLAKAGTIEIDWLAPGPVSPERFDRFLRDLVDVSQSSWKADTGTTLDQSGPATFMRRLSELAASRGWLSIWTLRLDGKAVATEYQLVHDGYVHALRSDFRQGLGDISPGSHLSRVMLERLFEMGWRRYYMGPGNNAYKFRWSEDVEPLAACTIFGRTPAGRVNALWERHLRPWASRIRSSLRASSSSPPAANDEVQP